MYKFRFTRYTLKDPYKKCLQVKHEILYKSNMNFEKTHFMKSQNTFHSIDNAQM